MKCLIYIDIKYIAQLQKYFRVRINEELQLYGPLVKNWDHFLCRINTWKQISYHFSSRSVWLVSESAEEAVVSRGVLWCQRTRSWGECLGGVWVWRGGSGHRAGIGCPSNLRSLDLYPRHRRRGKTASVAPWQRHRCEGTGPGRPAWSWNPSGSAGGKRPSLGLCQQ